MANADQLLSARAGNGSRITFRQLVPLVLSGTNVVKGQIQLPAGSWLNSVKPETPTAISGTPTSAMVRAGITDTGQEIMADVDCKAQGHIAGTIVAGFDVVGGLAAATTIFIQGTTAGGTAPAGTVNVLVSYEAPVR